MRETTVLAPTDPPAAPAAIPIRPSDRFADTLTRHVRIPIEPDEEDELGAERERLRRERAALDYSAELL